MTSTVIKSRLLDMYLLMNHMDITAIHLRLFDALCYAGLSSSSQPSGFDDTVCLDNESETVLDVSLSPFLKTHTAPFTFNPGGRPKSFDLATCPTYN